MKISDILQPDIANHSLLVGYYGGGNYGDELLLEIIQNLCAASGVSDMSIAYQSPQEYAHYHHEFGYRRVDIRKQREVLKAMLKSKRLIVGGGGLWGLDFKRNVFLLSLSLAVARWLFGKRVYLIGVGYYNSTTKLGHVGAWLAAHAANTIVARDQETLENFRRFNKQTFLDGDIAWYVRHCNLSAYHDDAEALDREVQITDKTLLITLRRFQAKHHNIFTDEVGQFLESNQDKPIIVALLEPSSVDPEQAALLDKWKQKYPNVQTMSSLHNPLALFLFFKRHARQLAVIAPQFHAILTAHLTDVSFMPITYDNKVAELLAAIGCDAPLPIHAVRREHLQAFANSFYGSAA